MDANLLTQAFEELRKLKTAIEEAEKQLAAGQRDLSTAAIGNQSKILAQLFKQIAGSELPKNPQYRNDFTSFSLELKDLLQRANNLRLQRANVASAPANPETPSPNNVSQPSTPVETPAAPVTNILEAPSTVAVSSVPPSAPKVAPTVSNTLKEPEKRATISESPPATQIVRPAESVPPAEMAPVQTSSNEPKKPTKKFALKGWLRKQGDVGLKTWKRRYFKYNDGKLRYFEQEDDLKPKGWIDLSTMISCAIDEGDKFSITCTNRVWHLQAEKAIDAQHWVKALQIWSQKHAVISGSGPTTSSSSVDNSAETPAPSTEVPVAPAPAVDSSVDRKRQREVEYEQMMREREQREQKRQRKLFEAQQLARREAEASRALDNVDSNDKLSESHKSPRITPADVEALRGAMDKLRTAQDDARKRVTELSAQLADLKQRSRPSAGLPVIMQLQAQLATRKDTIRQVWTPAVQQYHNELTNKQHQLLDIKAKSSHNAASNDSSLEHLDSAWAELEQKSHIVDIRLNDLAFERMHGHPLEEISTKEQVRSLADKKEMLLESLAANSVQLSLLDQKEDTERIGIVSKVAKVADTILTRRAQLLLARSQFQQLRMRCNMSWSGSSLLTYKEEMAMLSTEYAQVLVTNVKLHLLQQTGTLPRINVEELIAQLTQNPEMANKFSEWPKFVANYIYSQK
eukprot:TRINITY_DN8062_c0_g1_i1.p1 TRINITY_DN8062_c0_g1~~TRINITY_DN8062_c0_g1_i1.p1  ORF type:complete len:705 (+),score=147.05 TRINITY_DN8062_c0_g1_i1:55-2115(+)